MTCNLEQVTKIPVKWPERALMKSFSGGPGKKERS
jgi:hypothetical protein